MLIPVPAEPATDVSAAILAASAALARRYPDAALKLVPPQDVDAQSAALPAGSRIITISSTDGAPSATLGTQAGRPALTITGTGEGLRTAARALGDTKSALADGAAVTGMTATVPAAAGGLSDKRCVESGRFSLLSGSFEPSSEGNSERV